MQETLVIKVGSNVLTNENGTLDSARLQHIVEQIHQLKEMGYAVVLISSGAVASGRQIMSPSQTLDPISKRQLWAALGQIKLIETYNIAFSKYNRLCAQILVTKEDFRDRRHYLNMRNCIQNMVECDVVPIINENDVISVTELMFTDNDELAGLVAGMVGASTLIILTNVDGVFTGNPSEADSTLISEIKSTQKTSIEVKASGKSQFGRGGMMTKLTMAQKTAQLGITVQIANGKKDFILVDLLKKADLGTRFIPAKKVSSAKTWIAHSTSSFQGDVVIDSGAKNALFSAKPTSLLPVGIKKLEGHFKKGDIVRILDEQGKILGLGKTSYDLESAQEMMGKKNQKAFIHYDYLYLNES
ncbi:glutamate 5-kinase [bacterium]|nr:MAG: glutamate 5-kinase [bacterium]